ncbi:anti-sigma factor [Listeria grayi]|uniref:Regulator of SigK n=1 Tax=Listeria grayi DSM 20601 TaxID=525367 RepID=D7UXC7_LISGR|nr:anti-sigma factor [Listeria grayi]EFI84335.1 hypothetical protein HMPREF0556_10888 [Listeria grayi DSM 20601]
MNKQQAEEKLIDYLNGSLTESETRQLEEALQQFASLQEELDELNALMADLPYSSEPVSPNDGMKERILENVFKTDETSSPAVEEPTVIVHKKKRNWIIPSLVAVLALSLIGNIIFYQTLQDQKPATQNATDTKRVKISKDLQVAKNAQGQAIATVIHDKNSDKLVIEASDLKKLSDKERYQVWLLKDGKPKRAGTFIANRDGSGGAVHAIAKTDSYDTVAITVEPDENSKTPKGPIILSAKL